MDLKVGTCLHGFNVTKCEDLHEIDGEAIQAIHADSGARVLYLKNDDNNKSFAIGFRTPPQNDTGVFHILEHSVLCGSRRFPVKEPFVDLLKGSMQTFLNAMTFSDKTLYPVASTNEQDLFNLMDVYLDAVFHPNIYEKRQIFEQEGWHYELADGELQYNGVVFNEMKGALSDATSVLYNALQAGLYPGNCYAFESGGTPALIPTLTYEAFLNEHRCHYRTDNSYIILYGNLDIDRALAFLDERYLSPVAAEQRKRDEKRAESGLEPEAPRTIKLHKPVINSAVVPMRTAPENACAGCAWVIGSSRDRTRVLATDILLDALFGSNEAPLKRRLLDLGLAHDINAFVAEECIQPFAVVQLRMPENKTQLSYSTIVENEVKRLLDEGLDLDLVEAALSHAEFQMREHDFGISDGVIHAMTALSGWLYNDDVATDYLRYEDAFAEMRRELLNGYFEELARSLFCENEHKSEAEVVPDPEASDGGLSQGLATIQAALTPQDVRRIDDEVSLLRDLQQAADAPEAVACLPRLTIDDIDDAPEEPAYGLVEGAAIDCMRHSVATRGITYVYRYFDLAGIAFADLPYVSILANVLGKLGTASHTAAEIDTLVQGKLGNLAFFIDVFEREDDPSRFAPKFIVSSSSLSKNAAWTATLPREIMLETDFSDKGKILDILKQRKISMERAFSNSGHTCASMRVKSYYSSAGVIREHIANVEFYRFLCDLIDCFDDRADDLSRRLAAVAERVFCDDRCMFSFAGDDADYERFWAGEPDCGRNSDGKRALEVPPPVAKREAFIVPSDVCYASVGWDRRRIGGSHCGAWLVASRALSYDYLWNEVRVKGGAYGVGFRETRSGNMRFYSYRDPHLDRTLDRFAQASTWLSEFDPSPDDLAGFVVATVAGIDAPVKPRLLIKRQMGDYFTGHDACDRARTRQGVIDVRTQDVRALAPTLAAAVGKQAVCVFGNREILESSKADLSVSALVG